MPTAWEVPVTRAAAVHCARLAGLHPLGSGSRSCIWYLHNAPLLQSRDQRMKHASLLADVVEAAAESPRLAATLASGGLLSLLLQTAAELAGACGAEEQVG